MIEVVLVTDRDIYSPALIAWQARVRDFLFDCAGSGPESQAERIRDAFLLFDLAPDAARPMLSRLPREVELENMLAIGAYESAAMALLGRDAGFMLSRGGNGCCMASVVLPNMAQEMTGEGATVALALLAAQAAALLVGAEEEVRPVVARGAGIGARLN